MNKKLTRAVAVASAATVAALSFAGLATAAPGENDTDVATMPTSSNVTIHKFASAANATLPNDGSEVTDLSSLGGPLPGAQFTMKGLDCGLDLATNEGWYKLAKIAHAVEGKPVIDTEGKLNYTIDGVAGSCTLGNVVKEGTTTDPDGLIEWTAVPRGLYYVAETVTPKGHKTVAPFVLAVPMTNPTGDGWLDTIHVYPKDVPFAEKTPGDENMVGDIFPWTIEAWAMKHEYGTKAFYITDTLDSRLSYVAGEDIVKIGDGVLTKDSYDVRVSTDNGKSTVWMILNERGLETLHAVAPAKVSWTLSTKVEGAGPIQNEANIFDLGNECEGEECTGGPGPIVPPKECTDEEYAAEHEEECSVVTPECDPEVEDCETTGGGECEEGDDRPECQLEVECEDAEFAAANPLECTDPFAKVKFAAIDLTKIDAADGGLLEGAKFDVLVAYGPKATTDACGTGTRTMTIDMAGTSSDRYRQLRVSDFANGQQIDSTHKDFANYCLVETGAPKGYEKLPQGIPFVITSADGAQFDEDNDEFFVAHTVKNAKRDGGFTLPLTGGVGTVLFVIIGGVLLVGAVRMAQRSAKTEA